MVAEAGGLAAVVVAEVVVEWLGRWVELRVPLPRLDPPVAGVGWRAPRLLKRPGPRCRIVRRTCSVLTIPCLRARRVGCLVPRCQVAEGDRIVPTVATSTDRKTVPRPFPARSAAVEAVDKIGRISRIAQPPFLDKGAAAIVPVEELAEVIARRPCLAKPAAEIVPGADSLEAIARPRCPAKPVAVIVLGEVSPVAIVRRRCLAKSVAVIVPAAGWRVVIVRRRCLVRLVAAIVPAAETSAIGPEMATAMSAIARGVGLPATGMAAIDRGASAASIGQPLFRDRSEMETAPETAIGTARGIAPAAVTGTATIALVVAIGMATIAPAAVIGTASEIGQGAGSPILDPLGARITTAVRDWATAA